MVNQALPFTSSLDFAQLKVIGRSNHLRRSELDQMCTARATFYLFFIYQDMLGLKNNLKNSKKKQLISNGLSIFKAEKM